MARSAVFDPGWCGNCKQYLPLDRFWKSKGNRTGLSGFCKACMRSRYRKTHVRVSEKLCAKCEVVKASSEFGLGPNSPDGLQHWCEACSRDHEEKRVVDPSIKHKSHASNRTRIYKERRSLRSRLTRFGISEEQYREMLYRQGGRCAICDRDKCPSGKSLSIDHDHATGRVRGLLCMECNTMLGKAGDSQDTLMRAAKYLANGGSHGWQ